jgi:hypothetical protein
MALINKAHVKKFALDYAKAQRGERFERVSAQFLEEVNAAVINTIRSKVQRHPSKGKTLMGDS